MTWSSSVAARLQTIVMLVLMVLAPAAVVVSQETPPLEPPTAAEPKDTAVDGEATEAESTLSEHVDAYAGIVVGYMAKVIFWDPVVAFVGEDEAKARNWPAVRLVVLWLIFGAVFMTVFMGFINLRGFFHSLRVVAGTYDDEGHGGEVSHFQALSTALSATVGLGNIAGVAVAVNTGGPGAVFWMVVAGVFGMTSKFTECTLGQKYRRVDAQGRVSGGPMEYLKGGLKDMGLAPLGFVLASIFALLCIGGSLGGGNMFQVNQSFEVLKSALNPQLGEDGAAAFATYGSWVYGGVSALLVGLVIIGGVRRIAATAGKIVPAMCLLYVGVSVYILIVNYAAIPDAFATIFKSAFSAEAAGGGFLGALLIGVQRAAFSNEAGIGSAAIAHAAAKTDEPVREGIVALLEPFIDTVLICTMTGLVVVVTGAYVGAGDDGAKTTADAWGSVVTWFPYLLALATVLFAFSTMISWSYYGERCWGYLFGTRSTIVYKLIFLTFIVIGAVIRLGNVIDFSDMMILGMAFPNLLGCLLLSSRVRADLRSYWDRLRAGEFQKK